MKTPAPAAIRQVPGAARNKTLRPFLGLIDAVIVEGPAEFAFAGAVPSDAAEAAWMWMVRNLAPDLIDIDVVNDQANLDSCLSITEVDPSDFDWDHATEFKPVTIGPTGINRPGAQGIVVQLGAGHLTDVTSHCFITA